MIMMTVVDDNLETVREAYRQSTENLKSFRNVSAVLQECGLRSILTPTTE
jgi:hypothetical protein